jgi:hypothetical protein
MKKPVVLIFGMFFLVLFATGCTQDEQPVVVSSDARTVVGSTLLGQGPSDIEQTATQSPPTTEASFLPESDRIARLMQEDGTGDVYFGQSVVDTMKVLDDNGISYEVYYRPEKYTDNDSSEISYLLLGDGTSYTISDQSAVLMENFPKQTYSGIKFGDPASKVTQTYGEQEPTDFNNGIYFRYDFPSGDKIMRLTIGVDGHDPNSEVNYIDMMYKGYH